MGFEKQLQKAERSSSTSAGSPARSVDDSLDNDYSHHEKYKSTDKKVLPKTKSNLNRATSFNDLTDENLLSDEIIDIVYDEGKIKQDMKYSMEKDFERIEDVDKKNNLTEKVTGKNHEKYQNIENKNILKEHKNNTIRKEDIIEDEACVEEYEDNVPLNKVINDTVNDARKESSKNKPSTEDIFSTPNLSEYQLENEIKDHQDLLANIKSFDIHRLPRSDMEKQISTFKESSSTLKTNGDSIGEPKDIIKKTVSQVRLTVTEGLHAPYFPDNRSRSRSRSRSQSKTKTRSLLLSDDERSRSVSYNKPHLARGDSYQNTVNTDPSKYELPPEFLAEKIKEADKQPDEREFRESKLTMGESIAAAELLEKQKFESITEDPSLITTGDYTNFNVDTPKSLIHLITDSVGTRPLSSTTYLKNISRSSSKQPGIKCDNEKIDAYTDELLQEGALVTNDPFSRTFSGVYDTIEQVSNLDEMDKDEKCNKNDKNEKDGDEMVKPVIVEDKKNKDKNVEDDMIKDEPIRDELADYELVKDEMIEYELVKNEDPKEETTKEGKNKDKKNDEVVKPIMIKNGKDDDKMSKDEKLKYEKAKDENIKNEKDDDKISEDEKLKDEKDDKTIKDENIKDEKDDGKISEDEKLKDEKDDKTIKNENLNDEKVKDEKDDKMSEDKNTKDQKDDDKMGKDEKVKDEKVKDEMGRNEKDDNKIVKSAIIEDEKVKDRIIEDKIIGNIRIEDEIDTDEEIKKEPIGKSQEIHSTSKIVHSPSKLDAIETETIESLKIVKTKMEVSSSKSSAEDDLYKMDNMDISQEELFQYLRSQPVYIYTSLAGGMHIVQRTNELSTILSANKIEFTCRDLGTDGEAKKIWKRQAHGKVLPGVVRGDELIGDWKDIELANEKYIVRQLIYETL